jgi:hypothetical protein
MSNERVYVCASHEPKLAEGRDDLGNPSTTEMVKDLARRHAITGLPDWLFEEWEVDFPRHWRWLRAHRNCTIEIHDEYGVIEEVSKP